MNVNLAIDGSGIAIITLDRPRVHNAFDAVMIKEILAAFTQLNQMEEVRVILLKANGKSFSAGADLGWMQRMVEYDSVQNKADARLLADLMHAVYHAKPVVIGLVQGAAYGGGVGLVACCDIVLAAPLASFCLPEVKLGLIPAVISPYLIRAMGVRQAKRYAITTEPFTAEKALMLGLVHEIVLERELLTSGYALAEKILVNGPQAVKETKQLFHTISDRSMDSALMDETVERIAMLRTSDEAQKRLRAFLRK